MTTFAVEPTDATVGPYALWGKWGDPDRGDRAYPLLAHSLDTAAVAGVLWDEWISEPSKDAVASLFDDPKVDVRKWFEAAAGMHDLGKADPLFQGQLLRHSENSAFTEYLDNTGIYDVSGSLRASLPPNIIDGLNAHLRHEAMSSHIAMRCGVPLVVAIGIAGHHGKYADQLSKSVGAAAYVAPYRALIDESEWAVHQDWIVKAIREGLGVSDTPVASSGINAGPAIPLLTGLISVADWLASERDFLNHRHLKSLGNPRAYIRARATEARARVEKTLGVPVRVKGRTFHDLFPGFEPRPVQVHVDSLEHGPGLTVIMVPMGEGKTEAVLRIHADQPDLGDSMVFALPTTATADAMFERVLSFYGDTPGYARLQHMRAILNAFYDKSDASPIMGVCDSEHEHNGLTPNDWFSGRHRGLLAPITVSTCDQVLAAAVSHKYITVRMAALANKHVILDEVHTYDPYQQHLLERLLGWLGYFRTRVTILSATLPSQQLAACVNAYESGWHRWQPTPVSGLTQPFPYPGVARTDGNGTTVTAVASERVYTHHFNTKEIYSPDQDHFNKSTAREVIKHRKKNPHVRIGVIVNTVDRAITIAQILRDNAEATNSNEEIILLHSRMTVLQREAATAAVHASVGKNARPQRPVTIVSTQIAEASLDIDFDDIITDLAPMASLLQRMGRQWRHSHPDGNGGWTHPPQLSYRFQKDPTITVLAWMSPDQRTLEYKGCLPYTRAELTRTFEAAAALNRGKRTDMAVPGDMQAAVDAAYVTFADLQASPDWQTKDLNKHLAEDLKKTTQAEKIGVEAKRVLSSWRRNPDPTGNAQLEQLTDGIMWSEEAVTRFRDRVTFQVLIYDTTGRNPHAYHKPMAALRGRIPRETLLDALQYVVSVSPPEEITEEILRHKENLPEWWAEDTSPLLSGLIPISINDFDSYDLTDDGLVRS